MGFTNRIRLPFELKQPQFPEDKTTYRYANGVTKTLSVVVRETYAGETDYLPAKWHRRLTIALAHDNVTVEGDQLLSGVSKDGDYEINWPPFLNYLTAKATFLVNVTPFDNTNSNCMTCEQASQLNLHDDSFPDELNENTTYTIDVADNDAICCYPPTFSITSFNSVYLDSATIDQDGIITIHTKSGYNNAVGISLVTYRVTCPNGSFDEGIVTGDPNSEAPGCLAPSNIVFSGITSTHADVSFTPPPGPAPDHYLWRLYKTSAPGVLVQSGTSTTVFSLSGLTANTEYILFVRSQCDGTNNDDPASNFISNMFSTNPQTDLCGQYLVAYTNPGLHDVYQPVTYLDCSGNYQTILVPVNATRAICVLQSSSGVPVSLTTGFATSTHLNDTLCSE